MTIFEFDIAIGKKHKTALLAINDRATDMCWLALFEGKETKTLTRAEIEKLKPNESRKSSAFLLLSNAVLSVLRPE